MGICKNVITEVGFGPGNLVKNLDRTLAGAPYVILGREYNQHGLPHMDSQTFDWDNPAQNLTFHWFKHNIMCKSQPWICEEEGKKTNKDTAKKDKGKEGKSGKKGRRNNRKSTKGQSS